MELPTDNNKFYTLRLAESEESLGLLKDAYKDNGVTKVIGRISPHSVFNCASNKDDDPDNWSYKRTRHPAKHIDWIDGKLTETAIDAWLYRNAEHRDPRDLNEAIREIVFYTLFNVAFGLDGADREKEAVNFYYAYKKQLGSVNRQLALGIPPLSLLYHFGKDKFLDYIEKRIDEGDYASDSLIAKCMNSDWKRDMQDDPDTATKHLIGEISSIFWGGVLSMAITITAAIYYLYKNPEQYAKVYDDPDTYAVLAIKEAMRLSSGSPLIIRRERLDSGDKIGVCPFVQHRKAGTAFDMHRFSVLEKDSCFIEKPDYSNGLPFYIPFGIPVEEGGRACAGQALSMKLMPKILHTLMTRSMIKMDSSQKFSPKLYCGSLKLSPKVWANIVPMYEIDYDDNLDIFHKTLLILTLHSLRSNETFTIQNIVDDMPKLTKSTKSDDSSDDSFEYDMVELFKGVNHVEVDECLFEEFDDLAAKVISKIPVQHIDAQWIDIDTAMEYVKDKFDFDFEHDPRTALHHKMCANDEMLDDVSYLIELTNSGILAHLCTYDESKTIVDLSHMYKYEVYPELLPYGAKLVIDNASGIPDVHIELPFKAKISANVVSKIHDKKYTHRPGSKNWQMAYNVFVSTAMAYVTIVDHALYTHLIVSGHMSSQFITNPKMYQAMKPFMYKVFEINESALQILTNEGGILSRIFSLTSDGVSNLLKDYVPKFNIHEWIKRVTNGDTSVGRDMAKYYDVFYKLCKHEFPAATEFDIQKYAGFMLNASAWHEHIGNMAKYVIRPKLFRTKVFRTYPNSLLDTQQGIVQNIHLVLLTSVITMPKISDDLWRINNKKHWHVMQDEIRKLELECENLKPQYVECSVSL